MTTRSGFAPAVILGAALLSYFNAFRGVFQFDDFNVIVDNPAVHSLAAWLADAPRGIRPFLKLSYALNWRCGPGPFGFHLVNVAIHGANAVLVYRLSRRLFALRATARDAVSPAGAWFTALLFAVHPLQTESVTYISGRSMSLMAFCYLASLLTYVRGVEANSRFWLHAASPALFLTAALTKEAALTLPLALVLWEACHGGVRDRWKAVARRQAAHWIVLGCAVAAMFGHPGYRRLIGFGLASRAVGENLLSQVHGVAYLLSRAVWVHRLNIDPELPVRTGWTPALAGEALLLLSALAAGWVALRRSPVVGFGVLWFFLQLTPSNSVIPRLDVANERHLYLASWGIFLCVGYGLERLRSARPGAARWVAATAAACVILLGGFTVARNQDYRSEVALWEATVRRSPGKARAHNNLGYAYQLAGLPRDAARSYREAIRLEPGFGIALGNLATLERMERELLRKGGRAD